MITLNLKKIIFSQLVSGSFVLFVGSIFTNLGGYLFHLMMGRMLGPSDYGIFASLISLTYLFGIPISTLSFIVVRYMAFLRGKNENKKISFLYHSLNQRLILFGVITFFLLFLGSPLFDSYLHLNSLSLIWLTIASTLIGIYLSLNTSVLQAFLKFKMMSLLGIFQIVIKLIVSIILVYFGLRVFGATLANFLSVIIACLASYYFVKPLLAREREKGNLAKKEFIIYAIPVFISSLSFTSLYMTDVILARHFLSGEEAGFYASLSTLGKIIFFASSPVVMTMFPLVSERQGAGKSYFHYLLLGFLLVLSASIVISGIYYLFPQLMVTSLFGVQFLPATKHLFSFAIFLSLYSLNYLLVNFYLSIKKVWVVAFPLIFAVMQIILIYIFHQDISQIIQICIIVSSLLLASLLLYCLISYVQEKKPRALGNRSGI